MLEAPTILLFFVSQDIILPDRAIRDILGFVRHILDHITPRSALYLPGNQVLAPTARLRVCPSAAMKRGCTKLTCGSKPGRAVCHGTYRGSVAECGGHPALVRGNGVRSRIAPWCFLLAAALLCGGAISWTPAGNGLPLRVAPGFFAGVTGFGLSGWTA